MFYLGFSQSQVSSFTSSLLLRVCAAELSSIPSFSLRDSGDEHLCPSLVVHISVRRLFWWCDRATVRRLGFVQLKLRAASGLRRLVVRICSGGAHLLTLLTTRVAILLGVLRDLLNLATSEEGSEFGGR